MGDLLAVLVNHPSLQSLLVAVTALVSEDAAGLASGTLVAEGQIGYGTAFLGLAVGIALGDAAVFGLGRAAGAKLLKRESLETGRMERAATFFRRHGPWAIIGARCIPGTRVPTYLTAGAMRMRWSTFLRTSIPAAAAWAALLLLGLRHLGRTLGDHLGSAHWLLLAAVVVIFANLWIARGLRRRSRAPIPVPAD